MVTCLDNPLCQHCSYPLHVTAVDNQPRWKDYITCQTIPLNLHTGLLHTEKISLYVIHSLFNTIILEFPWLHLHNPLLSWREILVMLYGLTNAPTVFQAFISEIFKNLLNQFVMVYTDNILIYSVTLDDHILHVHTVLTNLLQHQLYMKAEKCKFHRDTIMFLRYV